MCSDGFWEYIDESKMLSTLNDYCTAEEWLNAMKSIVIENGADSKMDNFTAVAILNNK